MNYASNDDILKEVQEIGKDKFTAEQMYQIGYLVVRAYHEGRTTAFIEVTQSIAKQTETV